MYFHNGKTPPVAGRFISKDNERYYVIEHSEQMPPFFMSIVSNSDHWLFVSSTGGLTAGRVSPEFALFPYETVDKLHDSNLHTGSKTIFRLKQNNNTTIWQPFNQQQDYLFNIQRNIYKNALGNKLCFEEINHDLGLSFSYCWLLSDEHGFVRRSQLTNLTDNAIDIELLDGLQNILPANTPRYTQTNSSNLVDAYKWNELDNLSNLAVYTLYSGITDRAEPCESLKANTVYPLGLSKAKILLSSNQISAFIQGAVINTEQHTRGTRGAFLVNDQLTLTANSTKEWQLIANLEQTQAQAVQLKKQLKHPEKLAQQINIAIANDSEKLAAILAKNDSIQVTAEETVSVHHYANVLFNTMRGGTFTDQLLINSQDFSQTVTIFNHPIAQKHQAFFATLPKYISVTELSTQIDAQNDLQLVRLFTEYLPISFGRRHGDPSRPWNQFEIKLTDKNKQPLIDYQGNWRDIFQNWEALTFSYPDFIEHVIAKFVNASTIDGYNPYRIGKNGIDWEVEDIEDPWSYIGYWGDHQIIYLLKLLELSDKFHPNKLASLLQQPIFSYANVPYELKPYAEMVKNAKSTVRYNQTLADQIEKQVAKLGSDGKLILEANNHVYQVNLFEKLLVTLLSKLSNLVIGGGVWLNTQRPEWNDANNALVGQGLSVVTLCYMRRFILFFDKLISKQENSSVLSVEVKAWLLETATIFEDIAKKLLHGQINEQLALQYLTQLGESASHYRSKVYAQRRFTGKSDITFAKVKNFLTHALFVVDHSIAKNQRDDQLFQAYNTLTFKNESVIVNELYPMLEGQVAALSSGALSPQNALSVIKALFASNLYLPNERSFLLYPDRKLPGFFEKNSFSKMQFEQIPLLNEMLKNHDLSLINKDDEGKYHFNASLTNAAELENALQRCNDYSNTLADSKQAILALYESVFNHNQFTGRSGGMFGFEGLGCIYWHMISKLLLAVQENYFHAKSLQQHDEAQQLGEYYYRVRAGIGFNKTVEQYGAFPTDPYSHTPKHAGAQQPGMTGQVKEEILTRFGELGISVHQGIVSFNPCLLRKQEFVKRTTLFKFLAVNNSWQEFWLPEDSLAFTWCQTPIVYLLQEHATPSILLEYQDGHVHEVDSYTLTLEQSEQLFNRSGELRKIVVSLNNEQLFTTLSAAEQ
jgi:hypothetical protein